MNKLYVLVGIPASGKSTYAKSLNNVAVFSSDEIRKELFGDEKIQAKNWLVFKTLYNRVNNALKTSDALIDATNTKLDDRQKLLTKITEPCVKVAVVFKTPVEVCISRDKQRARMVGEDIIRRYNDEFVMPSTSEGFDEIIIKN